MDSYQQVLVNVSGEDIKAEEYKSLDREFAELAVAVNKYLTKGEK